MGEIFTNCISDGGLLSTIQKNPQKTKNKQKQKTKNPPPKPKKPLTTKS